MNKRKASFANKHLSRAKNKVLGDSSASRGRRRKKARKGSAQPASSRRGQGDGDSDEPRDAGTSVRLMAPGLRHRLLRTVVEHALNFGEIPTQIAKSIAHKLSKEERSHFKPTRLSVARLLTQAYRMGYFSINKPPRSLLEEYFSVEFGLTACTVLNSLADADDFFSDSLAVLMEVLEKADQGMNVDQDMQNDESCVLCVGGGYTMARLSDVAMRNTDRLRDGYRLARHRWGTCAATAPEDPKRPYHSSLYSAVTFQKALDLRHCRSATVFSEEKRDNPVEENKDSIRVIVSSIGSRTGYCAELLARVQPKRRLTFRGEFLFNTVAADGRSYEFFGDIHTQSISPKLRLYSVFDLNALRARVAEEKISVVAIITDYKADWRSGKNEVREKADATLAVLRANKEGQFLTDLVIRHEMAELIRKLNSSKRESI